MTTQQDYCDSETYAAAASFAPHFADTLIDSIYFKPTDHVLDIGCGDGIFTSRFAPQVGYVLGVHSSPSMIDAAKTRDCGSTSTDFRVVDCRHLEDVPEIMNGNWDEVASNAAFH
ncbi:S-adenosyl-L-methionine-dependent methyltransferase [Penicillium canescens]|nr:S-adenosyl-L-methionine-dependent methyltransferase [Penicillium canescens]